MTSYKKNDFKNKIIGYNINNNQTIKACFSLLKKPGVSADCDSGYEASSTMESLPTPSHNTSPHADVGDIQETLSLSESFHQTPTYAADQLDTSQDSLDDNNASSTVSHISDLSGLSDLSGQDWKPMAGSMIWVLNR